MYFNCSFILSQTEGWNGITIRAYFPSALLRAGSISMGGFIYLISKLKKISFSPYPSVTRGGRVRLFSLVLFGWGGRRRKRGGKGKFFCILNSRVIDKRMSSSLFSRIRKFVLYHPFRV